MEHIYAERLRKDHRLIKMRIKGLLFVLIILLIPTILLGAESRISGDVNISYNSAYIWRGFDIFANNDPAIFAYINLLFGESGFSVNVFRAFAISDRKTNKKFEDFDLALDFSKDITGSLSFSAGFIYYILPHLIETEDTSREIYIGFTLPQIPFSPNLMAYHDFDIGDGQYIALSGSYDLEVNDRIIISNGLSIGYNNKQYINERGISDIDLNTSAEITINRFTIAPEIHYVFIPMDEINDTNEFWGGIRFTFNF